MHKEYQSGKQIVFEWDFYTYGIQDIPTSASISISNNSGTAVITSQPVVIDSTGTLSYTLAAGSVTEARNYRANLTYTVAGVEKNVAYLYDVVKYPLRNEVSDADLFIHLNELRDKIREKTASTTSTGGLNYLVCSSLKNDFKDYTGGFITISLTATDSTTVNHEAKIISWSQSTGTCTFSPSYTSTIASGTVFSIRPSFEPYILNAFNNFVLRDIRNKVYRYNTSLTSVAGGYIDSTAVNTLTIFKTLELYCFSQVESENDKWDVRYKAYAKSYADEFAKMCEPFDKDNDGNISDTEDSYRPMSCNIGVSR